MSPSDGSATQPREQRMVQSKGLVRASLSNDLFEVELEGGRLVLAHLDSTFRLRAGRVGAGDQVQVALARYDRGRGRITGKVGTRR
ncbi:MAG: translation initiation factor IF-1 [Dehalococcoidia bacterium]|nr:translation initiation factor IF-1 [Dehalococcoidia bacterium]